MNMKEGSAMQMGKGAVPLFMCVSNACNAIKNYVLFSRYIKPTLNIPWLFSREFADPPLVPHLIPLPLYTFTN